MGATATVTATVLTFKVKGYAVPKWNVVPKWNAFPKRNAVPKWNTVPKCNATPKWNAVPRLKVQGFRFKVQGIWTWTSRFGIRV